VYECCRRNLPRASARSRSKSSLDTYGKALVPPVGSVATYLLHSRNREGAWNRCRLRSSTLPVMQVLSRQCRPQRSEEHATCLLCPQSAEVETTEHFLSSCQSPSQCQLRRELCSLLEQALQQWHEAQRLALMADSSGPPPAAAALAVSVRLATASATSGYDTLTAMLQCMRTGVATSEAARVAWCELLLGRCSDAVTGKSWDARRRHYAADSQFPAAGVARSGSAARRRAHTQPLRQGVHRRSVSADEVDRSEANIKGRTLKGRPQHTSKRIHIVECQAA